MCIFCKIVNKEIPSSIVYEDDEVIAILDLSQANIGHTLVMPKKHYENVLEVNSTTWSHMCEITRILAKTIVETFNCDGCNIVNNCKEAAGQTINHLHIHIIPRFKNDSISMLFPNNEGKYNLEEVREKIVNNLTIKNIL